MRRNMRVTDRMKWKRVWEGGWNYRHLPKRWDCCDGCVERGELTRPPVFYRFDGWDGFLELAEEKNLDVDKLIYDGEEWFKVWLNTDSLDVEALVTCARCHYNPDKVEIVYTPEEKEILRRTPIKTLHVHDHTVVTFDAEGRERRRAVMVKAAILPRGSKNKKPFY